MRRYRQREPVGPYVECSTTARARFQEVDALRVVWHGHYISWFEDGRNAFGRQYGFGYQDILEAGYIAPIVHVGVDYYRPALFDQVVTVRTRLHPEDGAKIAYSYVICDENAVVLASGASIQVFTDVEGMLVLARPRFFEEFLSRIESDLIQP